MVILGCCELSVHLHQLDPRFGVAIYVGSNALRLGCVTIEPSTPVHRLTHGRWHPFVHVSHGALVVCLLSAPEGLPEAQAQCPTYARFDVDTPQVVSAGAASTSVTQNAEDLKLKDDYAILRGLNLPQTTLGIILGGGAGTRLYPLTKKRAKPAVPLGANYRLIDIPVSNCLNSGITQVCPDPQPRCRPLSPVPRLSPDPRPGRLTNVLLPRAFTTSTLGATACS